MSKKLTKGSSPMIGGVVSGVAEYFDVDPVLLRLLFLLGLLVHLGVGLLYLACMLFFPDYAGQKIQPGSDEKKKTGWLLIGFGLMLLIRNFFPQITLRIMLSLLFIAVGAFILIRKK